MRALSGFAASAMAVSLAACAGTVQTEQPYAPEVYNAAQWTKDVTVCRGHALGYDRGFSPKAIGQAGAKGLAQNAGSAPVNVLIPLAGAGGGIVYESFEELGLTDLNQQRVFVKCLDVKTFWDHSALEIEPNP